MAKEIEADQARGIVAGSQQLSFFCLDAAIALGSGEIRHYSEPGIFVQFNQAFPHIGD